jgi:hypothetical protein
MASAAKKTIFTWSDEQISLLLECTLDFKAECLKENTDFESVRTKYNDIAKKLQQQGENIDKERVGAKLKKIRASYKEAVDKGKRSGGGRVVMMTYDICSAIWGGSPSVTKVDNG